MDIIASGYFGQLLLTFAILAIAASGYSVILGAGMFSMAPAAIMGVGAYASTVAYTKWDLTFPLAAVIGVTSAAIVSALLSLFAWRLEHLFLGIATLGVAELLVAIAHKTDYIGGSVGLQAGFDATPLVVLVTLACVILAFALFRRTRLFREMRAVGDDSIAAQSIGINTKQVKVYASVIGGVGLGIAGVLFAFQLGSIQPPVFGFQMLIQILLALLIGGKESFLGPIVGAAIIIALPELARLISVDYTIAYGIALIVVITLRPQGVIGERQTGRFAARSNRFFDRVALSISGRRQTRARD